MKQKWPNELRKGDVFILGDDELVVEKVEPVFGGSWFDISVKGWGGIVSFGHREKVQVKG